MVHRAGIKNQAAETLSRLDSSGEDTRDIEEDVPLMVVDTEGGKPDKVCYLCDVLTIGVAMLEILARDIADPPPSLPELAEGQSKADYCKRTSKTMGTPGP